MGRRDPGVHGIKPKRGIVVAVDGLPGTWRVLEQAPGHGEWWVQAADEDAKAHKSPHGSFESAHTSKFRKIAA